MYPSHENIFVHDRPRLISSFVRHDPPYPVNGLINPFSHPATTRNQSIEHSFHSPGNNMHDKSVYLNSHGPHDSPHEHLKILRTQPNMTPFPMGMNNNHSIPSISRANRPGHHRTGSHPLLMSNFSGVPSHNGTPTMQSQKVMQFQNMNPMTPMKMSFPSPFTPKSTDHLNEMREDKVIQFLERQNAVIEKLAVRIQQEERINVQREKRDLEFKLRNLENERMIREQKEENMKHLTKIQAAQVQMEESMRSTSRSRRPSFVKKEKSQNNLLETLGKMYLVQKLSSKPNQRSKSMANGLARNPLMAQKSREIEEDFNDDDQIPAKPVRFSQQNSFKVRRAGLSPMDLEELAEYNRKQRKSKDGSDGDETGRRKGLKKEKSARRLKEELENEEEARKLEEEIRKQKEKKKKQAERRLKAFLWGITYSKLLFNEVKAIVDSKKANIQNKMSDNLMMNFEVAQTFMINCGDKFLRELVKESKSLELYHPKKTYSTGDLDKRMEFIFQKLKLFFDKLIVGTTKTNINHNFLRFMASLSEDSGVLPSNFMFDFEVKRLQFTHYATLKMMTPQKSKMIIGCFMLLRILVHKIILRPWTVLPGISKGSVKMNNLITIASILYHIVLDFYRGSVATHANNQAHLPVELKIKPKSVPLPATDEPVEVDEDKVVNKKEDKPKEAEPISGLYRKDELKACFVERKKLYDQLKALVDGWLEQMYNLVHDVYIATPKEERDNLGNPI